MGKFIFDPGGVALTSGIRYSIDINFPPSDTYIFVQKGYFLIGLQLMIANEKYFLSFTDVQSMQYIFFKHFSP